MSRKYKVAVLGILILMLTSAGVIFGIVRTPSVQFSAKDAFQEESFALTLKSGLPGGRIYYTLDGNNPTLDSAVYTEPIPIEEGIPLHVTVVKAAVCQGGQLGEVYTRTYFVGEGVSELFDVMLVSLTADEDDLYNEETGILTNYELPEENTDEAERIECPAYIEFYEADGTPMLAQGTGIAVSGHGSRIYDQKSIKLISNTVYDPDHPTFDYDFFEADMAGNATGQSYNRLVLRSGGTDHNDETTSGSMIRWNVVSRLAKEAGIICAGARPGILFLNGEYYGIIQLQEKYTRYNIAHAIGAQKDDIEKYETNEVSSARFGGYYTHLHLDLNDPESRQRLENHVDIDDMLKHYAVNLIMNNVDWPTHNFLSWKCAEGSASALGDGKVRFFLYDLDAVYRNTEGAERTNTFQYLMEEPLEDSTDTLSLLMTSDVYRQQFIDLSNELMDTTFSEEHVLQVIDEENEKIRSSMELYYSEKEKENQQMAIDEMKAAVKHSCEDMRAGLVNYLGASW